MPDPNPEPNPGSEWMDPQVAQQLRAQRHLLLQGPLDGERATRLAAELMTLEADGVEPITVTINSPGGDLASLFAVTDTLWTMQAPVETRCLGQARGTAAALVAAGTRHRRAGRHAQLVLELPVSQATGSAVELDRTAHAETGLADQLIDLVAHVTGGNREQVELDWRQGRVLSAEQARDEGLVDEVS